LNFQRDNGPGLDQATKFLQAENASEDSGRGVERRYKERQSWNLKFSW